MILTSQMAVAPDGPEEPDGGPRRREPEVEEAFDRLVSEGSNRLARPLVPLLATGFVGGIDVGVGVLAYLVVDHETGQPLLAAAAFPVGFIALLLARSELFTENFLVPVTARIAGRGSWAQLVRLWLVTLAANLAGGVVMAAMIAIAIPDLRSTAATLGRHYATLGVSWRSLLLAVLAGIVITLLTRMQHASDDLGPKLAAGIAMSFALVAAQLFHSVLDSILIFAGLLGGQAAYTWGAWALALGWSSFGNLIGGIGLVTSIRLLQVPHRVAEERAEASLGLLLLLQPGVAELEQVRARQDHQGVDREARRPREVDEACHQPGRHPQVDAERAGDEFPDRLAGALSADLFLQFGRPFLALINRERRAQRAGDRVLGDQPAQLVRRHGRQ
jgi:formate/nitrite transporter FocA (FNT family)